MGVLPRAIWQRELEPDAKHRLQMALNVLVIEDEGKKILVDTGLGNRLDERARKVFNPSDSDLIKALNEADIGREDINYVILTHLHDDHAGGVVSHILTDELTFPRATYVIQKREWEIAKNPDELNQPAYHFEHNLGLLERDGKLLLVHDDYDITRHVSVRLTGGHSQGFQTVWINAEKQIAIWGGDLFPTRYHLRPAITSAYDIHRHQSCRAKREILKLLQKNQGILFFSHEIDPKYICVDDTVAI